MHRVRKTTCSQGAGPTPQTGEGSGSRAAQVARPAGCPPCAGPKHAAAADARDASIGTPLTAPPVFAREAALKRWSLTRALQCGLELADALQ